MLMNYHNYYRSTFESDLLCFLNSIPKPVGADGYMGKGNERPPENLIYYGDYGSRQIPVPAFTNYFLLSVPHPLEAISSENRSFFVIALFFTVLVDQVCHFHVHRIYTEFQKLTRYPKYLDNPCNGMNMPPSSLFFSYPRLPKRTPTKIDYGDVPAKMEEAIPVMRSEVFQFFEQHHFFRVPPQAFWDRCIDELPDFEMETTEMSDVLCMGRSSPI